MSKTYFGFVRCVVIVGHSSALGRWYRVACESTGWVPGGGDKTVAITQGGVFRRDAPTLADYRFVLPGHQGPFPS